jgi:Rps23 Pro-64 3,4-dihydroxylase Tpa1-like proline 4-hydroxylase
VCCLTLQPGNGARYVRHLDTASDSSGNVRGVRRLTFVYYLNEKVETAMNSGGQLRIHDVPRRPAGSTQPETYMDVEPELGTLVVFRRSDLRCCVVVLVHSEQASCSLLLC